MGVYMFKNISINRNYLIALIFALFFTGLNIISHRDEAPLGYSKYEKYGFSLNYPEDCTIHESAIYFKIPTYFFGDLRGETQNGDKIFGVVWIEAGESSLNLITDEIIEEAQKMDDIFGVTSGESKNVGEKDVLFRGFNLNSSVTTLHGLLASWESPEGRIFTVYYIEKGRTNQELFNQLKRIVSSFKTVP
jgi:hypothetical protein